MLRRALTVFAGCSLAACATVPPTLEDIALDPDANRLEVRELDDGLLAIPVSLGELDPRHFVIDTGATRSVIFADVARAAVAEDAGRVRIHGMFGVEEAPLVTVADVRLGTDRLPRHAFAILPAREAMSGTPVAGIIGMDILRRYRLFSPDGEDLILLEADTAAPMVPEQWARVSLGDSPFNDRAGALRFLEVRVNGRLATALLDTGSAVNIMTFEFADFPSVRKVRNRLQRAWELEGANTTFQPRILVEDVDIRAGSRVWFGQDFLVKDVAALEQLGVVGEPFMIAGVGLLSDEVFYLDLAANELRMPRARDPEFKVNVSGTALQFE